MKMMVIISANHFEIIIYHQWLWDWTEATLKSIQPATDKLKRVV